MIIVYNILSAMSWEQVEESSRLVKTARESQRACPGDFAFIGRWREHVRPLYGIPSYERKRGAGRNLPRLIIKKFTKKNSQPDKREESEQQEFNLDLGCELER